MSPRVLISTKAIGSGPYIMKTQQPGRGWKLTAAPKPTTRKPTYGQVTMRMIADQVTLEKTL